MLKRTKRLAALSLLRDPKRAFNVLRHIMAYPTSKHIVGGQINITTRCNLKCSFCSYSMTVNAKNNDSKEDMDAETFYRILNLPVFKYPIYISLGKGEPLLHQKLFDFIAEIQKRHILAMVVSNGINIPKHIELFKKNCPDIFLVSLYDETYEQQLANVSQLLNSGCTENSVISVARIIKKDNLDDMVHYTEKAYSAGLRNIWFQQLMPLSEADYPNLLYDYDRDVITRIDEVRESLTKKFPDMDITLPALITGSETKKLRCDSLFKGFGVNKDGSIQPCCRIDPPIGDSSYGNMFEDPLAHINNQKYLKLRQAFTTNHAKIPGPCKNCNLLSFKGRP
ncbi:MAG: radical SAM protein [Magnetococcales bacterium]|nr:radical SAM protein [Magnetococcales bacterium]